MYREIASLPFSVRIVLDRPRPDIVHVVVLAIAIGEKHLYLERAWTKLFETVLLHVTSNVSYIQITVGKSFDERKMKNN